MGVSKVCKAAGMSRQNHYKQRRRREALEVDEAVVVELVDEVRRTHPRMGARKILGLLDKPMEEKGVSMGRDRMFDLLRSRDRLVKRHPRTKRTTQSRHSLPVFGNRIRDLKPTGPDQVWVADLTYLRTTEGFVFLALVMDAWSRKIVGSHVSSSLESQGCQEALQEALKGLRAGGGKPIHHSDRGCQYCCHAYVQKLQENGLGISMTEEMHCYENGKAERVIGTLKWEYGLDGIRATKADWIRAVEEAIRAYNEQRPHNGIQGRIPAQMHATG